MVRIEWLAFKRFANCTTVLLALIVTVAATAHSRAAIPAIQWVQQFGSSEEEIAGLLAVDTAGNSYVTGFSSGSLFGPGPTPASGGLKGYVAKFDGLGNQSWGRQFGIDSGRMQNRGIKVDDEGNIFTVGMVYGGFDVPPIGHYDAFAAKFNAQGDLAWSSLFGSDKWDYASDVVLDGLGNLFVTGGTEGDFAAPNAGASDAFVSKLNEAGEIIWSRQFGSVKGEAGYRLATDGAGSVLVAGPTDGSLFGSVGGIRDAFLTKLDANGDTLWSHQFGTGAADRLDGICVDENGDIYIAGTTSGNLVAMNEGSSDAFLRKYDASGHEIWTRQIGSTAAELGLSVTVGNDGQVYLLSATQGKIGTSQVGDYDVLVTAFDEAGDRLWDYQFGSTKGDIAYGIAAIDDRLLVAGTTNGAFGGLGTLSNDAFLVSINTQAAPGDFNGDGSVDAADYSIWRDHLNSPDPRGDGTGWDGSQLTYVSDGLVLMDDFLLWKAEFGSQAGVGDGSIATPEPASLALCTGSICMALNLLLNRSRMPRGNSLTSVRPHPHGRVNYSSSVVLK